MNRSVANDVGKEVATNLFVIGAAKAGTTLVHSVLSQFEDVYMSEVKEPGYFLSDVLYERGASHYQASFFASWGGQVWVGEATPWYLYSTEAFDRIAADAHRTARFIVCLREPGSRAISMYYDQVRAGYERRPMTVIFRDGYARTEADARLPQKYVTCGFYEPYLAKWFARYGSERILVLLESDLADLGLLAEKLSKFLGVPPPGQLQTADLKSNVATAARFGSLNRVLARVAQNRSPTKRLLRGLMPERRLRLALETLGQWNRSEYAIDAATESPETVLPWLAEQYAPTLAALEIRIGRDLNVWRRHDTQSQA